MKEFKVLIVICILMAISSLANAQTHVDKHIGHIEGMACDGDYVRGEVHWTTIYKMDNDGLFREHLSTAQGEMTGGYGDTYRLVWQFVTPVRSTDNSIVENNLSIIKIKFVCIGHEYRHYTLVGYHHSVYDPRLPGYRVYNSDFEVSCN